MTIKSPYKVYLFLKCIFNLYKLSKNPEDTLSVFRLSDALRKMGLFQYSIKIIQQDSQASDYLKNYRLMKNIDLNHLSQLPEGTLGKVFSNHMMSNNLKPDFYEKLEINDDVSYITMRVRESHDIYHTLCGFGIDVPSELGVLAFTVGQLQIPIGSVIIGASIFIDSFRNIQSLNRHLYHIAHGWLIGSQARLLFGADWNQLWAKPIDEVRAMYNIKVFNKI
ncbi:MAG: Coq4 family protein [Pseudobdellovibrio sp.]